jgi:hypothetical protein
MAMRLLLGISKEEPDRGTERARSDVSNGAHAASRIGICGRHNKQFVVFTRISYGR